MDLNSIKKDYENNGYIHLKNFLEPEELRIYLKKLNSEETDSSELSHDTELSGILFNKKLNLILSKLLDEKPIYFGIGNIHGNTVENRISWRRMHNDTRGHPTEPFGRSYYDPAKFQWPIVTVFFYLEDFENQSGCLKVVKGSHKKFIPTIGNYLKVFFNLSKNWKFDGKYSLSSVPLLHFLNYRNIKSKPGDLVIMNHSVHHSPNALILKLFPNLSLPVFLENFIEKYLKFLIKPPSKQRRMINLTYSKNSKQMEYFIRSRVKWIDMKFVKKSKFFYSSEFRDKLDRAGVLSNINFLKYYKDYSHLKNS